MTGLSPNTPMMTRSPVCPDKSPMRGASVPPTRPRSAAKSSATRWTAESAEASTNTEAGFPASIREKLSSLAVWQTDAGSSHAWEAGVAARANSTVTAAKGTRIVCAYFFGEWIADSPSHGRLQHRVQRGLGPAFAVEQQRIAGTVRDRIVVLPRHAVVHAPQADARNLVALALENPE